MIPKVIYQSWKTHLLPEGVDVENIKAINPGYSYQLYDDQDCRKFLEEEFGVEYVEAFDDLVPGAFKCDLWRYAMLFIKGGVYLDIDLKELVPLNQIISDDDRLVTAVDRKLPGTHGCELYQAFLAAEPRHPVIKLALEKSLKNVIARKEVYKQTLFDITGPTVLGRALNEYLGNDQVQNILPGYYPEYRIRLYNFEPGGGYIITSSGRKLFSTDVDYHPFDHYTKTKVFYRSRPRPKETQDMVLLEVLFLALVVALTIKPYYT